MKQKILRTFILLGKIILVGGLLLWLTLRILFHPSNERDWNLDQALLPHAEISGDTVTIHNIRNFSYRSTTDYTSAYYDEIFSLKDLKKVYFIVEPFSGYRGAAHTFLSFEFEGNKFLSASIEIRKEKGEMFSAGKGLLRQYELMYVLADERDAVKLRTNFRKDEVYLYPIKTTPEKAQAVFLDFLNRANKLYEKPEFYHTFFNNCTTNIAFHANAITPGKIPWSLSFILPASSDKYAFSLGLIDTSLTSFDEVREAHHINTLAEKYADDPNFSLRIRER